MGKLNEKYIEKDMKESSKCQAPFANLFFASLSVKVIRGANENDGINKAAR